MRRVLMTAATIIGICAAPTLAGAQVVVETGPVVDPAPGVVIAAPPIAGPVVVPEPYAYDQVYVAPQAFAYYDAPRGYYQDCWSDWGRRICRLKPRW